MLYGRRLSLILFLAVMALPLAGLDLFGQAKDDKKKAEPAKTETKKEAAKEQGSSKSKLEWKFEASKPFYQKMTTKTDQTMKVMNNDVTQRQTQTFFFSWTPQEKTPDGKWKLEQKILGVQMDIDIGGQPIKYDSTAPAAGNTGPLGEFFKALVGSAFIVTVDPKTYKITEIKGREEFVNKLIKANRQMEPLLNKILSEDALREMAEPTFAVIPGETLEKGKKWTRATTLDMGPIGKYKNEYTYTYEGPDKNLDKIDVSTKLTYMPPEKTEGIGGLPFRIKSAELKSKESKGTILFNRDKGRIEKSDMSVELTGTLDIEIGGQQTKVELNQTQKTDISTSDTNPVETKPASK